MVKLEDVAQHAEVAISTVSRAINHPDMVKEETRIHIEKVVEKLGYEPNRVARRLRAKKAGSAHIIGLIIPDIGNPFYSKIAQGVQDAAYANDYAVILCDSNEEPEREQFYLKVLRGESVDGVIIPPIYANRKAAFDLVEEDLPAVCFDRRPKGSSLDAVVTDNRLSAESAVEHLIKLGHRDVGFISGPLALSTNLERLHGYKQILTAHNIPIRQSYHRSGNPNRQAGYNLAEELIDHDTPPTAIFTCNNQMTLGALKAMRDRKIRIPEDMAIVGFDDAEWADIYDPPLTTVRQPSHEMGRQATEMLLHRIAEPDRASSVITLSSTLIVRKSCGSGSSALNRDRARPELAADSRDAGDTSSAPGA